MRRLIDADALRAWFSNHSVYDEFPVGYIMGLLDDQPTVDAVPVRHGKWMPREEGAVYPFWERYTCSACGKHADDTEYCPHCGARMVEDETD